MRHNDNIKTKSEKVDPFLYETFQEKYLETIYFQILRNSKSENFTKIHLLEYLSFSEYFTHKIFSMIKHSRKDKIMKESNHIALKEFISTINVLFSRYSPRNGNLIVNAIFNLVSANNEFITYDNLKGFIYKLLFELLIKSNLMNFDLYLNVSKLLRNYLRKILFVENKFSKTTMMTKKEYKNLIKKNPEFINLIILLLNLLTPINEKLIIKATEKNLHIYPNDDFEEEYEVDLETTPRINNILNYHRVYYKTSLFDNSKFIKRIYNKLTCNGHSQDISTDVSDNGHNNISLIKKNENKNLNKNRFAHETYNELKFYSKEKFQINYKLDKSASPDKILSEKPEFKNNHDKLINCILKNVKDINSNQACDIDINFKLVLNQNMHGKNYKLNDFDCKILKSKEYNLGDENNFFLPAKNLHLIKEFQTINNDLYQSILYIYSELKNTINSFQIKDKIQVLFLRENSEMIQEQNNLLIQENSRPELRQFDNLFSIFLKIVDDELVIYRIFKFEETLKNSNVSPSNNIYDKPQDIFNLVDNKRNESFYFYKIKNLIYNNLPSREACKYNIRCNGNEKVYFAFGICSYSQKYKLLFENYEELELFYRRLRKISYFLNKKCFQNIKNKKMHFDLIQKTLKFEICEKNFSNFHEIIDTKNDFCLKVQTLTKKFLSEDNKIFLYKMFDILKLNTFLNINMFPISNSYENENFFIIEYTNDDFKIDFNNQNNNFTISLKKIEDSKYFKLEVAKFKKLINLLNIKEEVSEIFKLINLQRLLIFSKF